MRYQETWIRGGSAKLPSQRSCADRYPVLKKFFSSYRRPFSVFDLGANLGYFSLRLTEDFDCVCVMVDNRPELLDVLLKNNSTKAVWLNTRLTPEGLWALSESECFDVVLAMSVLHHFGDRWQDALEALLSLGSYVITELPAIDDTGALNPETAVPMHNFMKKTGSRLLAEFPSHKSGKPRPCYLSKGIATTITRQTIDAEKRGAPALQGVGVEMDFSKAIIKINHGGVSPTVEEREFIPGMNLWNFLSLNGQWPLPMRIISGTERAISESPGDDIEPWNMIIKGDEIQLIDQNTKLWKKHNKINAKNECINKIIKKLGIDE